MSVYKTRKDCRLCGGELETIVDLGELYLSDFVDEGQELDKAPLELTRCIHCGLAQLRHTVDQDTMYKKNYWYQSGLNRSMIKALSDVVDNVRSRVQLQNGDIVLDIGANDGTLLTNYIEPVVKVACEPSNLASLAVGKADSIINDYFTAENYYKIQTNPAKVITAIAMFYDLEDPHKFVEDLHSVLAPDGIIVIQMMDLLSMLKYGDFPNICHEHLEYYSLDRFVRLMGAHGLEVFDVEYNGVNGGSLRAYVRHKSTLIAEGTSENNARVTKALREETNFFKEKDRWAEFRERIEFTREKIVTFIRGCTAHGQRVAVFGASTKGNTVLQYFGLTDKDIEHAAEVNPDKFGKKTAGSNIPIIPEQESLASAPDFYLILPWGFIDMFVKKLEPYILSGGVLIVPLPNPRLIDCVQDTRIEETWIL